MSSRDDEARWLDQGRVDEDESECPERGDAVEEREGWV